MLRITDHSSRLISQRDLARNQYELAMLQREATSGLRINQASDDPAGAASLVRMGTDLEALRQHQQTISRAMGEVTAAQTALAGVGEALHRARELSIAMANDSYTAQERADAAQEIRDLRQQIVSLANTEHDGVHLFAGFLTDADPFDGTTGAYSGDTGDRKVIAAPGVEVQVGINGEQVFAPAGGQDVLAVLATLATDLEANDTAAVAAAAGSIEEARQQVTSSRALLGISADRLQGLASVLDDRSLQLQDSIARTGEADAVETLSSLAAAQRALNASLQVSATMLSRLTLVDKL